MTDYLEKYREAGIKGDKEKAEEYYEKYKEKQSGDNSADQEEVTSDEDAGGEILEDPSGMTVSEAKSYAEDIEKEEILSNFLEMEKEGKNRKTLVDSLESKIE